MLAAQTQLVDPPLGCSVDKPQLKVDQLEVLLEFGVDLELDLVPQVDYRGSLLDHALENVRERLLDVSTPEMLLDNWYSQLLEAKRGSTHCSG